MPLQVRIEGAATLHQVAAQMRAQARRDLSGEMGRALAKATQPIRDAIRASAAETMPKRGGYAALFDASLRFSTRRKDGAQQSTVTLATYADGEEERRDIRALEKGNLRHPVFGRSRPGPRKGERVANPWTVTSIRAGFHKRGTDTAIDHAQRQLTDVIDNYAERLIK